MAENSAISWTDHTMNFWIGCTKVSPACTNCYAAVDTFARRERANGRELWGPNADRHRTSEALWKKPYQWNKKYQWLECPKCHWRGHIEDAGYFNNEFTCLSCQVPLRTTRQRVFVSSLSDICEIHPQITDDMRRAIAEIVMDCENLDFLFLTKRPENFNLLWLQLFGGKLPDNLWVGTTVENQKYADERIPALLGIPAKFRFLSCEPLLGHVDVLEYLGDYHSSLHGGFDDGINWVIAGGESGSKARPMDPQHVRSLREQCKDAGIAFHFKQCGEYLYGVKVGKKNAGRLLDGVEHNEFPK